MVQPMPIYEYVCDHCPDTHEALQRMSDPPLTACPTCDDGTLTKVFSAHNVGGSTPGYGGGCATPQACGPEKAAACGTSGCWN